MVSDDLVWGLKTTEKKQKGFERFRNCKLKIPGKVLLIKFQGNSFDRKATLIKFFIFPIHILSI